MMVDRVQTPSGNRFPLFLLPGWGIPVGAYPDFGQARTLDYGFFGAAPEHQGLRSSCRQDAGAPSTRLALHQGLRQDRPAASAFPFSNPLPALAEFIGPNPGTVLFGHSLGALLALMAASALPPGAIRALVLFAPFARFNATGEAIGDWPGQPPTEIEAMLRHLAVDPAALLKSFHRRAAAPEKCRFISSPSAHLPKRSREWRAAVSAAVDGGRDARPPVNNAKSERSTGILPAKTDPCNHRRRCDAPPPSTQDRASCSSTIAVPAELNPESLAAGLIFLKETDLRQQLANFAIPTLILHGDADRIVPPAQAERLAALLPGSRVRCFAGAGHLLPFTREAECRQVMMEFLDDQS